MKKLSKVLALTLTLAMIIGATLMTGVISASAAEYTVWSGTLDQDFTIGGRGVQGLQIDEITEAIQNDLFTNGVATNYKLTATASIVDDPSGWGYFSWCLLEEIEDEGIYTEIWCDYEDGMGQNVTWTNSSAQVKTLGRKTQLCLCSDGPGVVVHISNLTLVAVHEAGGPTIAPRPVETYSPDIFKNKVQVWSGDINKEVVTGNGGIAMLQVDEMNQAIRDDIAANGPSTAYLVEADAQYVSGASGYAVFILLEETEGKYVESWGKGPLSSCGFADDAIPQLGSKAQLGVGTDGSDDVINVNSLTIYAVHGGVVPSQSQTEPSVTEPSVTEPSQSQQQTDPSETEPTQPSQAVLAGDANSDGVINMKDVLTLRKLLADIAVEINEAAADFNGDGAINMKDVLGLRKEIAK